MYIRNGILAILFLVSYFSFSQDTLFTINNYPFYTKNFISDYLKDNSNQNVKEYLLNYVVHKQKLLQAKALHLDTVYSVKKELEVYKMALAKPYLTDSLLQKKLLKEAYERSKKEISVNHIMLKINAKTTPKDTLKMLKILQKARQEILQGKSFSNVAKQYSQDPSVKENGGNLGYFTVFQMTYPFETVAYNTKVGEVSKPFKTKFGYHILKVNHNRKARGKIAVSHLMLIDRNNSKNKIDSIYTVLQKDNTLFEKFAKQFSEDTSSAINNGKINAFGVGEMDEYFTQKAFALEKVGDITKPFKTKYGWHIVKLRKIYPIKKFQKIKKEFLPKINSGERAMLSINALIHKITTNYKVYENKKNINLLLSNSLKNNYAKLFRVENNIVYYKDFLEFYKKESKAVSLDNFIRFKNIKLINFYISKLPEIHLEYKQKYTSFKQDIYLFYLVEKEIWNKVKNNKLLQNYYLKNKLYYKNKPLLAIKEKVKKDYQKQLEQEWENTLKRKYKVTFNPKEKQKILKTLN